MSYYNKIYNPETNRFVNINGNIGKKIIKKYLLILEGGNLESKITFTMYHAPWCGFCIEAKPHFEKLMKENININGNKIHFIEVNADLNPDLIEKELIKGFPTFILDNNDKKITYNGKRDYTSFKRFLHEILQ